MHLIALQLEYKQGIKGQINEQTTESYFLFNLKKVYKPFATNYKS